MQETSFTQLRQSALRRLEQINSRWRGGAESDDPQNAQAVAELQTALEELQVAEEELRSQADELAMARQIAESERQRYQDLFQFAPDAYLVTDAHGKITEANRAATALFDFAPGYLTGKPMVLYVHGDDRRTFIGLINRLLTSGRSESCELRILRRDRTTVDAAITVAAAASSGSKVEGLRWLVRDVSQQKQSAAQIRSLNVDLEQRVQERTIQLAAALTVNTDLLQREQAALAAVEAERRRLQTVLEQIPEAVLILDGPDGERTQGNDAARRVWGAPQTEAERQRLHRFPALAAPDGLPLAADELPQSRALRGEVVLGLEAGYCHPDGRSMTQLISAAPICDEGGQITGAVVVAQDITQRKTLEQQKDEFLALAAHELKTPLTTVRGNSQLLLRRQRMGRTTFSELDAESLRAIQEKAVYAASLVDELLDLSRALSGHLSLRREHMDLSETVAQVVAQQQALNPEREFDVTGTGWPIWGEWDAGRLEQVLSNLLENAVKYSPKGQPVRVSVGTESSPDTVHLTIADQGIGIPPEDLPLVFERHFHARNVNLATAGLGLGLYLSSQIVRRHGGRIWAESEVGRGSSFHVVLPLAPPDDAPPAQ